MLLPNTVPSGTVTRFTLRVSYTENPSTQLAGVAVTEAQVVLSPLSLAVSGGNTVVGGGPVLLDASQSADLDGQPGQLAFSWQCLPPQAAAAAAGQQPPAPPNQTCKTVGGAPLAVLSDQRISVELQGGPSPGRNYTFLVTVSKPDGRNASTAVWLAVRSDVSLPGISLQSLPAAKVNPSAKLVLFANVSSASPASLQTLWSVTRPSWFADFLSRPGVAGTDLTSPSLVVLPGALPALTTLQFRLTATDSGGTTFSEITIRLPAIPKGLPDYQRAAWTSRRGGAWG